MIWSFIIDAFIVILILAFIPMVIDDSFEEFEEKVIEARYRTSFDLGQCIDVERNRLELEKLRQEKADRDRKAEECAEQERTEN